MPPKRKGTSGSSSTRTLRPRHRAQSTDQHEAAASNPRNSNLTRRRGRQAISASSTTPSNGREPPADRPGSQSRDSSPLTVTPTELQSPAMAASNLELSPELLPPSLNTEMVIDTATTSNVDPGPDQPSGDHQPELEADIANSNTPVDTHDNPDMDAEGDDDLEYMGPVNEDVPLEERPSPIPEEPPMTQPFMARSSVLSLTTSPSPPHDADPKSKSKSPELLPPPKSTGKEKAKARSVTPEPALDESNLLSAYVCPICYCPPTNATLTPCGHISCGPCLFAAVKTALQRNTLMTAGEDRGAKCPVCRASIPGWDGKGGGVIGLNVRAVLSL